MILIVDDDAALNRMVSLTLRGDGYAVETAADGREALERVEDAEPDAIVLDIEMPVMDGREFYRRLRQGGHHTPVIVVSAVGARRNQRELGADAYLEKPYAPDQLVNEIRRVVPSAV